jgi:hypothetical protein
VGAQQVLRASQTLEIFEARRLGIYFVEKSLQERSARIRCDLSTIVPRMHRVRGDRCAERTV